MKLSQKQIDRIYKISDWCIKGIVLLGFAAIFFKPAKYFWWALGITLLIAILINAIVKHWATDDEKEEFKQTVKEAARELQIEQAQYKRQIKANGQVSSPLKDLSQEQSQRICSMLNEKKFAHPNKEGYLRMAATAQFLKALNRLEHLDDSDMNNLRLWVEMTTNKHLPCSSEFNAAYRDAQPAKVNRMMDTIQTELAKIR